MPDVLVAIILMLPLVVMVVACVARDKYGWRGAPGSLKIILAVAWLITAVAVWLTGKFGNQALIPATSDYWLCSGVTGVLSFMVMVLFLFEKGSNPPWGYREPHV